MRLSTYWRAWLSVMSMMVALAGCGNNTAASTPAATAPPAASGTPAATWGAQPCPSGVSPAFYSTLLNLTPDRHVETLKCADFEHDGTLEVLLGVRADGSGAILDVYLYTLPQNNTATQLYYDLGLYGGSVDVSRQSTILMRSVDSMDCINAGAASNAALQATWSQEIGWNGSSFAPQVFPGIYPDQTRYDAEEAQAQVDAGKVMAATPVAVVNDFFTKLLRYPAPDPAAALLNSDGTTAQVRAFGFTVDLQRLISTANNRIWEITGVEAQPNLGALTAPAPLAQVRSPFAISGSGRAPGGAFTATVRDHARCPIGHVSIPGPPESSLLTGSLAYTADPGVVVPTDQGTLAGSAFQEGTLWLTQTKPDGTLAALQVVKVLLG